MEEEKHYVFTPVFAVEIQHAQILNSTTKKKVIRSQKFVSAKYLILYKFHKYSTKFVAPKYEFDYFLKLIKNRMHTD